MNTHPNVSVWVSGARLRTLPLAVGPVLLGSASAWVEGGFDPLLASLALLVAVSLQIGVNYANDYSDGIRGTDKYRVGPARLTGSGHVEPQLVRRAALVSFVVSIGAGVALIVLSGMWWVALVGVVALWAAWTYTGGTRPYGYRGLGEVVVFVFFGPVATAGTAYVQVGFIPWEALMVGIAMGFFASAVLLINNLRDVATDEQAGKNTLSVQIGARASKGLITALMMFPYLLLILLPTGFPWLLLVLSTIVLAVFAVVKVWSSSAPTQLVSALQIASATSLAYAVFLSVALVIQ